MYQLTVHHAQRRVIDSLAALDAQSTTSPRGTVLMVPGYTGSKEDFAPLLDPLAANGFRAVAVDLPGQYQSPGPADENAYLPLPLGAVVSSLIGELPEPVVLLGHSYGGLVARGAVLDGAHIAGLILLCTGPAELPPGQRMDALIAGEPVMRSRGVPAVYELKQLMAQAVGAPQPPAPLAEFYRVRFLASPPQALLGMGYGLMREIDRVDKLAAVLAADGTKVAVISGEHDDAWGVEQQAEMARRLGVDLTLVPQAGHSPAVENPAGLLTALLPLLTAWLPEVTASPQ